MSTGGGNVISWLKLSPLMGCLLMCQPSLGQEQETILTLFYLVNQTGSTVKVRVLADGQTLFTQQISAQVSSSLYQEVPPPPSYPGVELKIPIKRHAERLEVQELSHVGRQKTFDITGLGRVDAGFRITIRDDGILLAQDYYPAR